MDLQDIAIVQIFTRATDIQSAVQRATEAAPGLFGENQGRGAGWREFGPPPLKPRLIFRVPGTLPFVGYTTAGYTTGMKATAKELQLRAMREASLQPRKEADDNASLDRRGRISLGSTGNRIGPARLFSPPSPPVVKATADRSGAVPLLAREGDCASCDRRRALLKAAKARRRPKKP